MFGKSLILGHLSLVQYFRRHLYLIHSEKLIWQKMEVSIEKILKSFWKRLFAIFPLQVQYLNDKARKKGLKIKWYLLHISNIRVCKIWCFIQFSIRRETVNFWLFPKMWFLSFHLENELNVVSSIFCNSLDTPYQICGQIKM